MADPTRATKNWTDLGLKNLTPTHHSTKVQLWNLDNVSLGSPDLCRMLCSNPIICHSMHVWCTTCFSSSSQRQALPRFFNESIRRNLKNFQAILFLGLYFFAKGNGPNNDPFRGYVLVFVIAGTCILIGDLNQVFFMENSYFQNLLKKFKWNLGLFSAF